MTALGAAVLSVLCWLVPPAEHHYYEHPDTTAIRYEFAAVTIAIVARASEPLDGLSVEQTAMLLGAVLARESAVRDDVMTCRRVGLGGARGGYQVERRSLWPEACRSLESATYLALRMLHDSWHTCDGLPMAERAAEYTGGANWRSPGARRESRRRVKPALQVLYFDDVK